MESAVRLQIQDFYISHRAWLLGWLRKKTGCPHQAADLAHDTFMRLLTSPNLPEHIQAPRAFLTTTAKHLIVDQARRAIIEKTYLSHLATELRDACEQQTPQNIIEAVELLEQLCTALEALPDRARETFLLHYLDGLSQEEVASRIGVSSRMVRKYLTQALLNCATFLEHAAS